MTSYHYKVVAIDGPSGAGKSTISRLLAHRLGFQFLDTGSLYRAIGLYLIENSLDEDSTDGEIISVLKGLRLVYQDDKVFINDSDYSTLIRTPKAGHFASVFSARKSVRDYLLDLQREFAMKMDLVAEGRDMTTVVFTRAWRKFYLDASQHIRAQRRYNQMQESGKPITYEEALIDIVERDKRDMNRPIAPLKRADDVIYIDSTHLAITEVIETMLFYCKG